jgi:catechol-2,3-dioxygenase
VPETTPDTNLTFELTAPRGSGTQQQHHHFIATTRARQGHQNPTMPFVGLAGFDPTTSAFQPEER